MTNGLDRLERLFSKKKNGAATRELPGGRPDSTAYNSMSLRFRKGPAVEGLLPYPTRVSPLDDMHFPQPSFIRPKAARMVPRDDHAKTGHANITLSRPGTANRSSSIYEPSFTLPPRPSTATSITKTSPKYVPPPRSGAARGPQGPPVAYTAQVRSTSVAASPNRRTFSSQRSSGSTNFSNDGTYSNYSLSSSGSSTMSASTITSHSSSCSTLTRPSSCTDTLYESSIMTPNEVSEKKRSPSLLQRRDVCLSPLYNLDTYLLQSHRDSSAITLSSGEVSPATIVQLTPPCSSLSPENESRYEELEAKNECSESLSFSQAASEVNKVEEKAEQQNDAPVGHQDNAEMESIDTAPAKDQSTLTETPVLRRDSVFSSIVLPPNRPKSPTVSPRRRSRIVRHPMSLRYQRHLPLAPKPLSPNSVLMEPDLGDFLLLGDDDIAEDVPAVVAAASAAATHSSISSEERESAEHNTGSTSHVPTDEAAPETPPKSPPKTPTRAKGSLALQKALPSTPVDSTPSPATSSPISPESVLRRRILAVATAPASQPPTFKAPPPSFHSLLPDMRLLPSPMSLALPTLPASVGDRRRSPAGEARMAAAFEIARIASQYKFDLAYIATIWPKNMSFLHSASGSTVASQLMERTSSQASRMGMTALPSRANRASHMSHASQASDSTITTTSTSSTPSSTKHSGGFSPVKQRHSKLEAQFLAAYGLATVRAPYSLSAPTHAKVLNTKRWLEFREPDAKAGEFSQSYGCAFYRGRASVKTSASITRPATPLSQRCYQRRSSTDDCDADTEQDGRTTPRPVRRGSRKTSVSSVADGKSNNRGIVFVAYRRKEVVDERLRQGEKDDLEALYRDVEALVDKILDVHLQQQPQAKPETQRLLPAADVVPADLPGGGTSCALRQSQFLGVKAA
ncbi:hypothetical protein SEPCBS57363_003793 [Sporothrix epigloea]|uniref:Uncharacterized protein n=1 Tax=Sporothrix epigloea TaxID=1892477 RepID=A0ABP0DQ96_9PEZI